MTWMVIVLGVSAGLFFLQSAWGIWATRSVSKRLVASAQAHEASERMHREHVERLGNILESACPRCVILSATLQAERQKAGAVRA